ncbi:MAG: PQQ-binding-like beta-propeller repeat protein [Rikenellaceae bacterium]
MAIIVLHYLIGATMDGEQKIIATSYEGTVICMNHAGKLLWSNSLDGFMNHDINVGDLDGDGNDEVVAASADGNLYCIDDNGELMWNYSHSSAPLFTTTILTAEDGKPYVVCGGFDKYIIYVDGKGKFVKDIYSGTYNIDEGSDSHAFNLMRTLKKDGKDVLVVHSSINTNSSKGAIYQFKPLSYTPYSAFNLKAGKGAKTFGPFAVNDLVGDGNRELIFGGNVLSGFCGATADIDSRKDAEFNPKFKNPGEFGPAGYRMISTEVIPDGEYIKYVTLFGDKINIVSTNPTQEFSDVISLRDAPNGLFKDIKSHSLFLASEQSGGSTITVIDYTNPNWVEELGAVKPEGKLAKVLENSKALSKALESFARPEWERAPLPLYYMGPNPKGLSPEKQAKFKKLAKTSPKAPAFLGGAGVSKTKTVVYNEMDYINEKMPYTVDGKEVEVNANAERFDRSVITNDVIRTSADHRRNRFLTQEEILDGFSKSIAANEHGVDVWVGHGRDFYYYSTDTKKKMTENLNGKMLIQVYAEIESHDDGTKWGIENDLLPTAKALEKVGGKVLIRNKYLFWNASVYLPAFKDIRSGEYKESILASLEESNSKTMDISVAGRMGLWAAGSMDSWSTRFTRDNPCYNRLRQISYQRIPNPSMRMLVYHIANGASFVMDSSHDPEYSSLLWEMIAKGLLYVPKRDEIVSINPVHLSVFDPDDDYIGNQNVKDLTKYDINNVDDNMVISRTDGSWPGGKVNEWDFTRYAVGVRERRLEFIPNYPHGMVLMTPPTDPTKPRGDIKNHLHPIYKNILKEYFTDGRNYYSDTKKSKTYSAKEYYKTVENAIVEGEKQLPLTVVGRVGWATAQTAPKHLRLTLVDGGYLNPGNQKADITFQTAKVKKVTDLVTNQDITSQINGSKLGVVVPCGSYLFLDIELEEELK